MERHDLYSSPDVIGVIRLREMRFVVFVACLEETRNMYKSLVGKSEHSIHRRSWGLKGTMSDLASRDVTQ